MEGVRSPEFAALLEAKKRSIRPMLVIYMTGYLGLSILAGFGHAILGRKVLGPINLGFVLIIANYLISWIIAIAYARVSARVHDPLVEIVASQARAREAR